MSSAISTANWQPGFLTILQAVKTHAKIQFRRLPAERREEAIAETIAAACVNYQIAAAQGRLHEAHPGTIADFAVKHVRNGRHVGGHQDAAKDPLSRVCQRRHGVGVVSFHARPSGPGTSAWRQIAIESRKVPIPDLAAFRIDFAEWLRTLTRRDRKIIGAFVSGERTWAVAQRFGISVGRVSQLRRKYEQEWRIFQCQAVDEAA